jgi:hypothetical protein
VNLDEMEELPVGSMSAELTRSWLSGRRHGLSPVMVDGLGGEQHPIYRSSEGSAPD